MKIVENIKQTLRIQLKHISIIVNDDFIVFSRVTHIVDGNESISENRCFEVECDVRFTDD
jgi:hypothetical protein